MDKVKVLIAGGTGLIGSALAEALLADGHVVRVLTRNPYKAPGVLPDGIELVRCKSFPHPKLKLVESSM